MAHPSRVSGPLSTWQRLACVEREKWENAWPMYAFERKKERTFALVWCATRKQPEWPDEVCPPWLATQRVMDIHALVYVNDATASAWPS